ncbi:hypothetical protein JR065_10640 [Xanthomonas sp. AmX2]|uniref:HEPN domain-containing protein n=1 Tax=Xanthomonas sp. TaxID=29446 RepID=UPI00197E4E14|nr:HEPN domain-containing protein [Xanthomonas sp.]MBN6150799.1 hypothetical protein [Xanthomonas sp.]
MDPKKLRKISYLLNCLRNPSRLEVHKPPFGDGGLIDYLSREIRTPDGRVALLTRTGLAELRELTQMLFDAHLFGSLVGYGDVASSLRSIYGRLLVETGPAFTSVDLIESICQDLKNKIGKRRFAVPLSGVRLEDISKLDLGPVWLVNDLRSTLAEAGESPVRRYVGGALGAVGSATWLVGDIEGTVDVATDRFSSLANLSLGLLAVYGAVSYENGATNFRLCTQMSAETTSARGTYLHWQLDQPNVTVNYQLLKHQTLRINKESADRIYAEKLFDRGFALAASTGSSQLEKAVIRAIHWFSDAQRDPSVVMQFVKYWSCVETFFTSPDKVVRSVSSGLATTLVAGGYEIYPPDAYFNLKKRISKLYIARCKAVHQGHHDHVSWKDVSDLSEWCAWLILTMLSLLERGYISTKEIRVQIDRLDAVLIRGHGMAALTNSSSRSTADSSTLSSNP